MNVGNTIKGAIAAAAIGRRAARLPSISRTKKPMTYKTWWVAPALGTVTVGISYLAFFFVFILSGFAFDECNPPIEKTCPGASRSEDLANHLVLAAIIATGLQWVLAYWLTIRLRYIAAAIPSVLTIAAIVVLALMPVGR